MNNSIPICFYPLRKMVLDDDTAFTNSILLKMHGKNFISYNSPNQMLESLLANYQPTLTKSDLISKNSEISDSSTQHTFDININKLTQILAETNHTDISVLLIDYHMPEMNGLDILNQIKHLPIKKALITGEHDYKIGVDAFNANLVDAYLRKDDPDFSIKIKNIVEDLEWKYFSELSSLITDIPEFHYLKNKHLTHEFKNFIREHNITAFCLSKTQGDFITCNADQKQSYFLVRNISQLHDLAKAAEDDGGSAEIITNLKQGKIILHFDTLEYWQVPACEWEKYQLHAEPVAGDSELFWAVM